MENCLACEARLYDAVSHCPYCGKAVGDAVADTPQAPPASQPVAGVSMPAPEASAPVAAQSTPAAQEAVSAAPAPQPVAAKPPPQPKPKPKAQEKDEGKAKVKAETKPETRAEAESRPKPPRKGRGLMVAAGVVAAAVVGLYMVGKSGEKNQACEQALVAGARHLAAGDPASARAQAGLAAASCSGQARVKAVDLQAAADKAEAALAACQRSFRTIASRISERRLLSARNGLDQLGAPCADTATAKDLRQQVEQALAAAAAAGAEARQHITEGNIGAARAALDQVQARNREDLDLAALRAQVQEAARSQDAARAQEANRASADPATAVVQATGVRPPALPSAPAPAARNPQADLAQSFLRDADQALSQMKFDAAKTYVESARRIDPNNPQAISLGRRIRERELQYLRDETTIK
ncbi:hypothetical protein AB4156_02160 [Cupriavidus sp. 2MCAB6]|uniref:hypothetical protein n=1 Tax=Cupriavidus sp. 2MCAB6 TaxID=3232981 RepID=UPI003F905766